MGPHIIWGLGWPVIMDNVEDRQQLIVWDRVQTHKSPRIYDVLQPMSFWMPLCPANANKMLHSMMIAAAPTWWLPSTFGCASQLLCQLPSHCAQSTQVSTGAALLWPCRNIWLLPFANPTSCCQSEENQPYVERWAVRLLLWSVHYHSVVILSHTLSHMACQYLEGYWRPRPGYTCISLHWTLFKDFIFFAPSPSTWPLYSL